MDPSIQPRPRRPRNARARFTEAWCIPRGQCNVNSSGSIPVNDTWKMGQRVSRSAAILRAAGSSTFRGRGSGSKDELGCSFVPPPFKLAHLTPANLDRPLLLPISPGKNAMTRRRRHGVLRERDMARESRGFEVVRLIGRSWLLVRMKFGEREQASDCHLKLYIRTSGIFIYHTFVARVIRLPVVVTLF